MTDIINIVSNCGKKELSMFLEVMVMILEVKQEFLEVWVLFLEAMQENIYIPC